MNKILKISLISLAGIVAVIAAIAAYVAATFDPNQYKPQLIQAVKEKTQRTLKLDGAIGLSFFPSIGASLGKASLSERDSDKEFAGVDNLRISLKLLPLLSKEVVVDAIEVKNLRASFIRLKDGRTSIDDLTGADKPPEKPAPAPAPAEKSSGPQVKIDIARVVVENATISYADQKAGAKYALSKLNLKTGRIASGVPGKIDLSANVQSDQPKLNLDVALKTGITFDLDKQTYVVSGLDFGAKGLAAGISNLVASAKGDIDAKLASGEFVVSKLAAAATGKQDGGDLDVKFDLPKLAITKDKVSGEKITLDATVNGAKSKMAVKLAVPAIDGNMQAFKAGEFTVSIDMQKDGATTKAKLTSPLAGNIEARRFEMAKLVATVNINDPKLPKNPIDATVNGALIADLIKETASLSFTTKLDDSNISGKAGLADFSPPSYNFDINIDQLDADRYLPKPAAAKGGPAPDAQKQPPAQAQAEQPLDLSALKGLRANGSLKIGSLKVSNVKASNVRVDLKAADGRVDVSPIAANLYQGTLAGALSLQATATPVITVKQTLTGITVGPLLKDAANFDTLEGKGNLSLDVSGQGATVTAIKKALNGSAAIKLADGAIKGINIASTIRDAKAKLGALKGEKSQAASQSEKTDFSELSASFSIKNGVAHNSDLAGKSPLLRLTGEGDIDIGNEKLDYLVKATVVATAGGQGGKELSDLNGVTVPVRLTGSFAAPQYKIDFAGIAAGAAKAVVEKKTEEIKARAQDQIKDRLKGLFGR
jgi:AsmA protein